MNILNKIYNLKDNELEEYVRKRINKLEDEFISSYEYNSYVGFDLDINPNYSLLDENDYMIFINNKMGFYIPLYTKMIYGMSGKTGYFCNSGYYYYIDDDSYILNFIKRIRKYEIYDDRDIFDEILFFLDDLFGKYKIDNKDREEKSRLILKNEKKYYKLNKEHKLSNLYNDGSAVCTEYSLLAHNILKFLGYDSIFVVGLNEQMSHAFNFVGFNNNFTRERENLLIDFSMPITLVDTRFKIEGRFPFIYRLNENVHSVVDKLRHGESLICEDYFLMYFNDEIMKFSYDCNRNYSLCTNYEKDGGKNAKILK